MRKLKMGRISRSPRARRWIGDSKHSECFYC
jgi:hypothetical protein